MSTRHSTRLRAAAAPVSSPALTGESDVFDGELSELSDSDAEAGTQDTKDAHEGVTKGEEDEDEEMSEHVEEEEEEDEWSEAGTSYPLRDAETTLI